MSEKQRWWWSIFRFAVLLVAASIFFVHLLSQAGGTCGAMDGGPRPGQEDFCGQGGLQVLLSAIPAGIFLAGGVATAQTHNYLPLVLGFAVALAVGITVPFRLVEPVCEGVYGTEAERRAALEGRLKLAGESEKDVCRRIGAPNRVDGTAWKYSAESPQNIDPGDLIVEFEAGKVRATRFDSVRY